MAGDGTQRRVGNAHEKATLSRLSISPAACCPFLFLFFTICQKLV